jgi:hypothetical protein
MEFSSDGFWKSDEVVYFNRKKEITRLSCSSIRAIAKLVKHLLKFTGVIICNLQSKIV